ncbi:MAG: 5,10-methylenetetrahydrofolate reductase [Acidimicrobiia bacterium]|nr:5,10-methylenetetrahydrofolate reductase [Acidimicrobiia bacterium]MYB72622.1 5,10-methylenetetrahydrofolate reductase [Acidimicrobiia bacterium]MYH99442.1 5,10-methylenetetrahydrofolate reductase [Acidimicrobiia bacterium]
MARIVDLLSAQNTLSFEFFPPADDIASKQLDETLDELAGLSPSFVSVTCGVGGDGHDRTHDIVTDICRDRTFPAMAHLTCVGHTREGVAALLDDYAAAGVANILALAGDPPDGSAISGDFHYASELVEVIRDHPADFSVGVAAHPEVHPRSTNRASDRQHLAAKLSRADFAITQFFFDPADYVQLCEELADLGCQQPVIPGVMPVIWPKSIRRFADMNGSTVPEDLFTRLESMPAPDRIGAAAESAAKLSQTLLDAGAPGIHLYTLNRPEASTQITELLNL